MSNHYRSTFTGVTTNDCLYSTTLTAVGDNYEVNVIERKAATSLEYTEGTEANTASKISPAEAKKIANTLAAAFEDFLGSSNYTNAKVHRIVATIEMTN